MTLKKCPTILYLYSPAPVFPSRSTYVPRSLFPPSYVPQTIYVLQGVNSDVPQSLCSPISMFPGPMFPSIYVPQSLCSPVLCSPIPMFPGPMFPVPMFPNPYVPQYLCSPIGLPMFPRYLSSPTYFYYYFLLLFFFLGGGRECWNNLLTKLASFFKIVATATLEDLFCSHFDRKRCVISLFQ